MTILGIIVGLFLISLMMLVHEGGHYFAGRLLKFKIIEFSIFMGPRLYSTEKDGIRYSFKLLPIGASVQFAGEGAEDDLSDYAADDPGLFFNRPRWARAIVVFAGPLMNFISAFLAFVIMFSIFGVAVPILGQPGQASKADKAGIVEGDRLLMVNEVKVKNTIDFSTLMLKTDPALPIHVTVQKEDGQVKDVALEPEFIDNYRIGVSLNQGLVEYVDPSSNKGQPVLLKGDKILTVNGQAYPEGSDIKEFIPQDRESEVRLSVEREGEKLDLVTETTHYRDPVDLGLNFTLSRSVGNIFSQALYYPWSIIRSTISGFSMMFKGQVKFSDSVTGPVGIVKMFGDAVTDSGSFYLMLSRLIFYFAMISVALGFTNLFPIPPLDGYHLLILAIEGIRRKDLPEKLKNVIAIIGLVFILSLAALVIYVDIRRFI